MDEQIRYRGKIYTSREIDETREMIATHRRKSRWFISWELCRKWNWVQPNGVLKDMICRGLLLRLNAQGLIELPPPTKKPPYLLSEYRKPAFVQID